MNLNKLLYSWQRIPETSKIFLLQNLAVMVKAGLPLADALNTLSLQAKNPKLRLILEDAQEKIRSGKTFAEALSPYTKDFGEVFVNMIAAGEASGSLEKILFDLYLQLKKEHTLKNKIRNALTYPVIIVLAMFGIGTFVVVYILPNITAIFKDLDTQLPLPTRVLIEISNFFQNNQLIVFPAIILSIIIFLRWTKTKSGRKIWHRLILKLPIAGEIIKKINITRFANNLSSLIKTDIPIADSLRISASVVGNQSYKLAILDASEKVKKGTRLAEIFSQHSNLLPPILIQMVAVGEETGALDEVLKNISDFYQDEVEQTMETLPVIIEPILMILMGVGVAGLAIAVILPIYSLTQAF